MKKMSAYSHYRRFLASLLVLAVILAMIPDNLISKASAASRIPGNFSPERTVIVAGEGASYNAGSATVVDSFTKALSHLAQNTSSSAGLIIIAGTVTQDASIVTEYAHTGTYYITGTSSAYSVTGGKLYFSKTGNTNNDLGGPTFFENIELDIIASPDKYFRLHANTSLIFGDGVTITDPDGRVRLVGGSYFSKVNSYIELNSGTVDSICAGNISKATGNCQIVIDGTANVSGFIAAGSWDADNGKTVDNATITVNGGSVNAIYSTPMASGLKIGDITIHWNGGTSLKGLIPWNASAGAGTVSGNYTVKMRKGFTLGENFTMTIPKLATGTVSALYLEDFSGVLDSKLDITAFNNVVIETGTVEYSGTSLGSQNFVVYSGAKLYIPNIATKPANVTTSGQVLFGEAVNEEHVHNLTAHTEVLPSCTAAGNSAYWSCAECGQYFSDAEGKNEIAENAWLLPAAHSLDAVAYKAPTTEATGIKAHYKCSACGNLFWDANGNESTTEAEVTIPQLESAGLMGDADGDGFVDAFDAALVTKYSVGAVDDSQLNISVLDLDGDNFVDAFDASLIQKYSVGAITTFPKENSNMVNCNERATTVNAGKTIKILGIGNSFTRDTMEYMYKIAESAGVKVELAIMYKSGSAMDVHIANGKNTAAYSYMVNTNGTWTSTSDHKLSDAVGLDWDYILIQESTKNNGEPTHYATDMPAMINLVRSMNTSAELIWNMTWSLQQNSDHERFANYGSNQLQMYNMIVDCFENVVVANYDFAAYIPSVTAIQNLRTSFIGDTVTRDTNHLDMNIGRYVAGLTMFTAVTGISVDEVSYNPDPDIIDQKMFQVAKESVKNAIAQPYCVTKSAYSGDSDKEIAALYGVDLSDYVELNWAYTTNAYWQCNKSTTPTKPSTSNSNYNMYICSDHIRSLSELPEGTVFILDYNWLARLHVWSDPKQVYSGTRPGSTGASFIKLSDNLYDGKYVAWNLTILDYRYTANRDSDMSALFNVASTHFRVYIPING